MKIRLTTETPSYGCGGQANSEISTTKTQRHSAAEPQPIKRLITIPCGELLVIEIEK